MAEFSRFWRKQIIIHILVGRLHIGKSSSLHDTMIHIFYIEEILDAANNK